MPTYHNPTGALLAANRRRDLAELVVEHGVPLVEDNALENAPLDDERLPPIAAYAPPDAPVLSAGSFSKAAWGGLRVGWMRGPVPLINRLDRDQGDERPGLAAVRPGHRRPHRAPPRRACGSTTATCCNRNLALVSDMLPTCCPAWTWARPKGGPSLWIELPVGTASAYTQVALRFGVEVIPGDQMSPTGDDQRRLRLPYTAEPPVLTETIRRLAQAWGAYVPSDEPRASTRPGGRPDLRILPLRASTVRSVWRRPKGLW